MEVQKREIEEAGWSLEEILPGHPVFHFARIGWSRMHPGEESL